MMAGFVRAEAVARMAAEAGGADTNRCVIDAASLAWRLAARAGDP